MYVISKNVKKVFPYLCGAKILLLLRGKEYAQKLAKAEACFPILSTCHRRMKYKEENTSMCTFLVKFENPLVLFTSWQN